MIENSIYLEPIKTRSWVGLNGEIIIEWDGVLLVYFDFYGSQSLLKIGGKDVF